MRKRDGHTKDKISDIMKFSPDTVYLSDKKLYIYRVTHRSQFFLNHNFTALSDEFRFLIFDRMNENQRSQRRGTGSPSQILRAPHRVLGTKFSIY